jgi:hypothetical protein
MFETDFSSPSVDSFVAITITNIPEKHRGRVTCMTFFPHGQRKTEEETLDDNLLQRRRRLSLWWKLRTAFLKKTTISRLRKRHDFPFHLIINVFFRQEETQKDRKMKH